MENSTPRGPGEARGARPAVGLTYAEEVMNGIEYQAACPMIQEGMVEEGVEIVRAIRERYDGEKRSPWNEIECGSNYARCMASYALLPALSGFTIDMVAGHVGFAPRIAKENGRFFWCLNTGWGMFETKKRSASLTLLSDSLTLSSFSYAELAGSDSLKVSVDGVEVTFRRDTTRISFEEPMTVAAALTIAW